MIKKSGSNDGRPKKSRGKFNNRRGDSCFCKFFLVYCVKLFFLFKNYLMLNKIASGW